MVIPKPSTSDPLATEGNYNSYIIQGWSALLNKELN